ncbi:MAG: sugar phosphate isomerase/epimerase [Verrucomicrobiae bacterium]|nr:sugar phosphate isomerase/epimerase [Verrucomicrobiae bacterium]
MQDPYSAHSLAWQMNRREFLRATGWLAAGAVAGQLGAAGAAPKTLFGSNVYGWTQYYQREKKPFNLDEVIAALADCGYDYLENFLDANNPESAARFAEKLRARGMRPVSLYTGAALHEAARAREVVARLLKCAAVCKEAGFEALSCNPDPLGREKTEEELKNTVSALKDLGQGLKELGLKLGIHHHLPEMQNQGREFHYVLRQTPPETVGLCYDVHWVWKGGLQPMEVLPEYGRRIVTWHLRQSRNGVWHEVLDKGDIDYEAVARYAREHQLARRFTVELALEGKTEVTRSAVENHRLSLAWAKKVFGA